MRTLYEAANGVEAHLLRDLLAQEGVAVRIHGEFLQGGVGELPAAGLVRLMVDDADYAAGRAFIERWEAAPVPDFPDADMSLSDEPADRRVAHRPAPPVEGGRGIWIVVFVLAAACWFYARAVEASGGAPSAQHVVAAAPSPG
jgi:hypothetical protein